MNKVDFNKVSSSYPPQLVSRVKYEINLFQTDPPPGICASIINDSINSLEASVLGPVDTPYDKGVFKLEISLPFKYPLEPPQIKFKTPIYHPNIDSNGRICLDILYMPPKGEWKPSLNLPTVLSSIRLLMSNPNPHDPLMNDITDIYKNNHSLFLRNAQSWTKKHAMENSGINDEPEQNEFRKKRLRGDKHEESKYEPDSKSLKVFKPKITTTTTTNHNNNNNNNNNNNGNKHIKSKIENITNNESDNEDNDDDDSDDKDSDEIDSDDDILKKNKHIINGNNNNNVQQQEEEEDNDGWD